MHGLGIAVLLAMGNFVGGQPATVAPFAGDSSRLDAANDLQQPTAQLAQIQVQFDAARFDTLTARVLGEIFDSAAARGLPTAPLVNLALEGAARRAGSTRILTVVRDHAAALADAREALGSNSSVADLAAGASALRSGVDRRTLSSIRTARPNASVEMPLVVLTDIRSRGVAEATAREAVTTLARLARNSDEALLGLQVTVAKNSTRGPGMAVDALNRYVRGTVSGSNPPSTPATTDRKPIRPPSP